MNDECDRNCIVSKTLEINPLFEADYIVLYFKHKQAKTSEMHTLDIKEIINILNISVSDRIIPYLDGYVYIYTKELFINTDINIIISLLLDRLVIINENFTISCSDIHHDLVEIKQAVNEAIYTSILIEDNNDKIFNLYEDIGTYKVILPFINDPIMKNYSDEYLNILLDFDVEYQGKFIETLIEYVLVGGDIDKCSEVLKVHKNTIRYRLEKINSLLNENILIKEGYEKVALAIRIYIVHNKLNKI